MSLSLGEMASIVSNRMYAFGETYAHAKAWVLANLSTSSTADGTSLDAIQTPITTAGGQALASRSANWYTPASLFSDLPSSSKNTTPLPGGLDIAGQEGNVLEVVNGAFALGAGGGGGLAAFTAFGSSPNANGGSVSGTNIVLQPADATHPGGVSTGAQTFGGNKTFDGGTFMSDLGSGWPGLAVGASVGGAQGAIGYYVGGSNLTVHSGSDILFYISNANIVTLKSTTFDMTGLGVGGSIKLKSPDGTVYTLTIANGGTVHIV